MAQKFNNNGSGVRGDMKAVIKAILLDSEVQNCDAYKNENLSKLKEPIIRYTQFARAVDKTTVDGRLWNHQYGLSSDIGQDILSSPSVFNFFLPIDAPNGPIEDNGYVAPNSNFMIQDLVQDISTKPMIGPIPAELCVTMKVQTLMMMYTGI